MTLYDRAKNMLDANARINELGEENPHQVNITPVREFAGEAGINIQNNAFGILLAFTAAKLIVQAVEEMKGQE